MSRWEIGWYRGGPPSSRVRKHGSEAGFLFGSDRKERDGGTTGPEDARGPRGGGDRRQRGRRRARSGARPLPRTQGRRGHAGDEEDRDVTRRREARVRRRRERSEGAHRGRARESRRGAARR